VIPRSEEAVLAGSLAKAFARIRPAAPLVIGIACTGQRLRGYWVLPLPGGELRAGETTDRPDVVIRTRDDLLPLLLGGHLDLAQALASDAVRVDGDPEACERLIEALR
jgi:hypothetical protein